MIKGLGENSGAAYSRVRQPRPIWQPAKVWTRLVIFDRPPFSSGIS